jgi:PAS domain S-box-containing protein
LNEPKKQPDRGTAQRAATDPRTDVAGPPARADVAHDAVDDYSRFLAESMPDKVFIASSDGAFDYVNRQWSVFSGLPIERIMGTGWTRCVHPHDVEENVLCWRRSIETGTPFRFERRLRRSDGVYRWHLSCAHAVAGFAGQIKMWVGSDTDIDDHKRAEREQRLLADLGERLIASPTHRDLLRSAAGFLVPVIADVCVIDDVEPNGVARRVEVVFADPEKQQRLGEPARRFPPQPGWHTPQDKALATGNAVLLANVSELDTRRIAHDADYARFLRAVELKSMMVLPLSARGKVLGILTLAMAESNRHYRPSDFQLGHQVAHLMALAVESARHYDEAQRATRAGHDLLAIVSHDLKSPLSVILLNVSVLAARSILGDSLFRKHIESIQRATGLMNRLIEDLLDTASIDTNKIALQRRQLAVGEFVRDIVESIQPVAAGSGQHLTCELPAQTPVMFGDPERLNRVFANLIGNAIKFTSKGGAIVVRARETDGVIEFSVADTGVGIAAEDVPHVFERFWRGRGTGRHGTGLGLAIAKGIIDAHGGQIWVHSAVGAGSTFFFTVPLVTPETTITQGLTDV